MFELLRLPIPENFQNFVVRLQKTSFELLFLFQKSAQTSAFELGCIFKYDSSFLLSNFLLASAFYSSLLRSTLLFCAKDNLVFPLQMPDLLCFVFVYPRPLYPLAGA